MGRENLSWIEGISQNAKGLYFVCCYLTVSAAVSVSPGPKQLPPLRAPASWSPAANPG